MRPDETFVGQPVRSLQQMLRTIAEYDDSHLTLIPDGPEFIELIPYGSKLDHFLLFL